MGLLYHNNDVVDEACAYADYTVFHDTAGKLNPSAAEAAAAAEAGQNPGMCPFST